MKTIIIVSKYKVVIKVIICLMLNMLLINKVSLSQISKNWYFGTRAGIDFTSGSPIAVPPVPTGMGMDTEEGCATVSTGTGALLFYTDGRQVYNAGHVSVGVIDLEGNNSSTQSAIIIPKPQAYYHSVLQRYDEYYIITVGAFGADGTGTGSSYVGNGIKMYTVTLNSGANTINTVSLTQNLIDGNTRYVCEKITAVCKGGNSGEFWLIAHGFGGIYGSTFYVWEIYSSGARNPITLSTTTNQPWEQTPTGASSQGNYTINSSSSPVLNSGSAGYLKVSQQGNNLALACYGTPNPDWTTGFFELYGLDNMTGLLTFKKKFTLSDLGVTSGTPYGVEFSPSGDYFYGTLGLQVANIWRFQTISPYNISKVSDIANPTGFATGNNFTALQLALDNKIYVGRWDQNFLSSITSPDGIPTWTESAVTLGSIASGIICKAGLPNFVQCLVTPPSTIPLCASEFAIDTSYCKTQTINLSSAYTTGYLNKWEIMEANSNCTQISSVLLTMYGNSPMLDLSASIFKAAHCYKVRHTVYNNDGSIFCCSHQCFCIPGSPALHFNGSQSVNLGSIMANSIRTIECWFKLDNNLSSSGYAGTLPLISRGGVNPFSIILWGYGSYNGRLSFFVGSNKVVSDINSWTAGNWYHVAGVITSAGMRLYINGVLQTSANASNTYSSPILSDPTPTVIGNYSDFGGFRGTMEEVRFWNSAQSEYKILSNMHCSSINEPTLRAYYKMDEGIPYGDNTAIFPLLGEYSGNNFYGVMNNFLKTGYLSNWVDGKYVCCPGTTSDSVTSCGEYQWQGNTYTASGIYTNTSGTTISILNLTILQTTSSSETVTFTNAFTWSATGATYTSSGVYTTTILNANGCDSIITLNLTIIPGTFNLNLIEDNPISCHGYKDGAIQATAIPAGNYTYSISSPTLPSDTNSTGYFSYLEPGMHTICATENNAPFSSVCSMIYLAEPQKLSTILLTDSLPNCAGNNGGIQAIINGGTNLIQPYLTYWYNSVDTLLNPTNYFDQSITGLSAGDYTLIIEDDHYCFDTTTITLGTTGNVFGANESVCDSYTWSANGVTYSISGIYTYTSLINGCPDTSILELTINDTATTISAIACDTYTWNGMTFNTSGIYTDQSINASGCINSSILNLTINNSTTNYIYVSECSTYTWALNGVTYTTSGIYSHSTLNSFGCGHVSILNLQIGSFLDCYCTSAATFTSGPKIFKVTIAGASTDPFFSNSNGCIITAPGSGSLLNQYSNFKTLGSLSTISQGGTFPFTIEENQCDGASYETFLIGFWIDYNHNGSFSDIGEHIFATPNALAGPQSVSGTFMVPLNALTGQTVLRVQVVKSNSGLSPCGGYPYGETEDYLINIIPPQPCTGAPNPGNTIASVSPACANETVNLSIQNLPTISGITYQWYRDTVIIPGGTNATYSFTMQTAGTYYCAVTCTNSSLTTNSNPVTVNLKSFIDCYCSGASTSSVEQQIYNVTVASSSTNPLYANSNGCTTTAPGPGSILNHYSNFKTLGSLTNISLGDTIPFTIVENECGFGSFQEFGTAIWIDYNHNASFSDPGEKVFGESVIASGPRNISDSFIVPMSALNGPTVMRVRIANGLTGLSNNIPPCGNLPYGEVEDYLINIIPATSNTTLNLSLFIEGYMNGPNSMIPVLANQGQPTTAIACDSIDVQLHNATSPYSMAYATRTVLNQDGTAICNFPTVVNGNYYIAVKHRSGIQTWSGIPINFDPGPQLPVVYDFSMASTQAYGANQIEVSPNVWAFYSGDIVADENIDLLDMSELETYISNFAFGYEATDINGDGNVDLLDAPIVQDNINNFIFSAHP